MNKWDARGAELQASVRAVEATRPQEYSEDEVRQAQVHGRQDLVLLVSHLSATNAQLSQIKRRIEIGLIILAVIGLTLIIKA